MKEATVIWHLVRMSLVPPVDQLGGDHGTDLGHTERTVHLGWSGNALGSPGAGGQGQGK